MQRARRRIVLFAISLLAGTPHGLAQERPKDVLLRAPNRSAMTSAVAELRKIHTPEGIEILEHVPIGGVPQWISIRGRNKDNPVLLLIHGGPGWPMMPMAWAFQSPWEDFFTVVEWDQRGAGKNWVTTDPDKLAPTMNMEQMVRDTEEMVAYVRERLHKHKIAVLGFSWGTLLGIHIAKLHPEWLSAYIGVGQSVSSDDERVLFDRTMDRARRARDTEALNELEAVAPYPGPGGAITAKAGMTVRKWARVYNGGWYGKRDFELAGRLLAFSPDYSVDDADHFETAAAWVGDQLFQDMMGEDLRKLGRDFKCPIIFIMGRYDLHTPYESAKAYLDSITAPQKKFVTFERSSHFVMFEEPGRFLVTLVNDVLPLTEGAAAYAAAP